MALKFYQPTSPGRRKMSVVNYRGLSKTEPLKKLVAPLKKHSGRGNTGRITVRHQGGGHKQKYRIIDFKQLDKMKIESRVISIEYDPNRNAFIMLVYYSDGEKRYLLAPQNIKAGDKIICAPKTKVKTGNRMMLKNIPLGFEIYNLELKPGKGGEIVRSAGTSARIISLETKDAQVELPSSEVRFIPKNCFASIGIVSNPEAKLVRISKAGRSRWLGRRPKVRGKAMNPRDHPHGGGEGGCPIGLKHPKTPWGLPALGFKTRHRKYSDRFIIKTRKGKSLIKT